MSSSVRRRCSKKTKEPSTVVHSDATASVHTPAVDEDPGSGEKLKAAIKHVIQGKDLNKMSLKKLRRAVVAHLVLPKTHKRRLEGTRRQEFANMAADII